MSLKTAIFELQTQSNQSEKDSKNKGFTPSFRTAAKLRYETINMCLDRIYLELDSCTLKEKDNGK